MSAVPVPVPMDDGVYFGVPMDTYLSIPRLSASGLQLICASPAAFWAKSWLNPDKVAEDEEETKAQQLGKAYHCARLEPERFHESYVREPCKDDFEAEGMLTSDAAVKAQLKAMGKQQTFTEETIYARCVRLQEAGYEGTIWPLEYARFEATVRPGQIPIPAKHFDQIVQDMERIRTHGEIAPLLTGGQAEVTILWTDTHGIPMKARLDYLTPAHWADLKTFDNTRGKELEQALADAFRFNRYYVQGVTHREAVEALRNDNLQVQSAATDEQRALVAAIAIRPEELRCWYVFQEKGGVPNLLAREFQFHDVPDAIENSWDTGASDEAKARGHEATRSTTLLFMRGRTDAEYAKRLFVLYSEAYQPGRPWFPLNAKATFSEYNFNQHWLEGKA